MTHAIAELAIYCAACGKDRTISVPLDLKNGSRTLHGIIATNGWVVQLNGDNLDAYCSTRCAE